MAWVFALRAAFSFLPRLRGRKGSSQAYRILSPQMHVLTSTLQWEICGGIEGIEEAGIVASRATHTTGLEPSV
jgi:hypothetical protein